MPKAKGIRPDRETEAVSTFTALPVAGFVTMYSVETAIVGPFHARRGDILAVRPSHPLLPLVVLGNTPGFPVRSVAKIPTERVRRLVLDWLASEVLAFTSRAEMPA
jgi:hypothetical protein